ncbi:MAG: hypothetical protein GY832_07565 [Chloroflexi bacterium]|nr:hypothetical protein [Chloroflexota bacterium]
MTNLPITHITLYKHGVGFFERRAELSGEKVELSFRVEEMNDILKSLTVIDWGKGQVLGVDYATPQSREERLAGCSIRLSDARSLRDLLAGLRGRHVRLLLDQEEAITGTLLGLDEVAERQPMDTSLVSLLLDQTDQVQTVSLGRVGGVEILDERGASDLRFFLQTALSQENYRQVTIRLTSGEHDLSVSYIAPAPTWRVSYRLVTAPEADDGPRALLLGWGIFDNRLEEDLDAISMSLVAGMPISFIYDLYTPFTPERPVVEEEARVAAAPVDFAGRMAPPAPPAAEPEMMMGAGISMAAKMMGEGTMRSAPKASIRDALAEAAPVTTTGKALGELFQYVIGTPVTVGRGQSAMVPIISADLDYGKDLLYNGAKMATHPVATLRLENATGLTLERGPVTVIEQGQYAGEAVLPFTVDGGEVVVPYAVELGVKVREQRNSRRELRGLSIKGAYAHLEEWHIQQREYQLNNSVGKAVTVLVEHPRTAHYDLFDTIEPKERTEGHWRFEVEVPARGEKTLKVQERRLMRRKEELRKQSYKRLQNFLQKGLLDRGTHDQVSELLRVWEKIEENKQRLVKVEKERQKIYQEQQQIQGNMGTLTQTGKEGKLRSRYVEQLEASEEQLKTLAQKETDVKAEIARLKQEVKKRITALK